MGEDYLGRRGGSRGGIRSERILSGEDPRTIEGNRLVSAGQPVYDFRELERWELQNNSFRQEVGFCSE